MGTDARGKKKGWYVAQWSALGWLETLIKVAALVVGISAGIAAISSGMWTLPSGLSLAELIVLVVLSLGLIAAIFDRLAEREVTAMAFVILNNLGHWGMVLALASLPGPGLRLFVFAALMLLGDLVKLAFLKTSGFSVRNASSKLLYGLTFFYVAGYATLIVLSLLAVR